MLWLTSVVDDVTAEVCGSPTKKSEHLARILKQTGVAANEVLFVGDGWTDYKTALEFGTKFVFLQEMTDWNDAAEKMAGAPDDYTVVGTWEELLDRVVLSE